MKTDIFLSILIIFIILLLFCVPPPGYHVEKKVLSYINQDLDTTNIASWYQYSLKELWKKDR
jgi:hypothetical protein